MTIHFGCSTCLWSGPNPIYDFEGCESFSTMRMVTVCPSCKERSKLQVSHVEHVPVARKVYQEYREYDQDITPTSSDSCQSDELIL